jgi:hypothetical protein
MPAHPVNVAWFLVFALKGLRNKDRIGGEACRRLCIAAQYRCKGASKLARSKES